MASYQKILVGVDVRDHGASLSVGSSAALKQALHLGREGKARVDVLHSTYDDPEQAGSFSTAGHQGAEQQARELHGAAGVAGEAWVTSTQRPQEALIQRVIEGGYDLLVTAKRSHLTREQRRLGTISRTLIHSCPGRVWVVHPREDAPPKSFLAATDLSPVGDRAVAEAADLARLEEGRMEVVHAWQVPMELQLSAARIGPEEAAARRTEIADGARRHIEALPGLKELDSRVRVHVACDAPSHLVLRVAQESEPDLVVMGTVSRRGLHGWLVGNTAEKVFEDLDTSLLTVKPDDFVSPLSS